jgi:hypothetical protein
MPPAHGQRLADLLPLGQLAEIADSYTLIPWTSRPGSLTSSASSPAPPTPARGGQLGQ